ncbi:RDD family protein [Zymobacter palmae]|uniref:Predicted membrane protein/domain n=1 Tax=Zymobacter palmae TaxID=33074 RepID=A0A348HBG6_9GAMM|nr:RDD family protein [Zymobacter palmae]BBG28968.1 predicted membrane protein/domain [Zymobacter palmae]
MLRAGFWRRAGAFAIDKCLLTVGTYSLFTLAFFSIMLRAVHNTYSVIEEIVIWGHFKLIVLHLLFILVLTIVTTLYHAILESSPRQATLGKRICQLQVTNTHGRWLTFMRALGRQFSKGLSLQLLGLGYVMACGRSKLALHDRMAAAQVIHVRLDEPTPSA